MRRLLLLAAFLAACGGDPGDRGPERPEPPELPTGEVARSVTIDNTSFDLYAGECPAIVVSAPGAQRHVQRFCPSGDWVTSATETCGWFAEDTDGGEYECDLTLPRVIYGKVTNPDIGWVCVGQIPEERPITSVRFLDFDTAGYILEPALPDEAPHAHLYTPGGVQYGEPPLDAPSTTIYDLCAMQAPWGTAGPSREVVFNVRLADSLQRADATVFLDAGAGAMGISGNAAEFDEPLTLSTTVPATSPGVRIEIKIDENSLTYADLHEWPDEVLAALGSDCDALVEVEVEIGGAVMAGQTEVNLQLVGDPCGSNDQ